MRELSVFAFIACAAFLSGCKKDKTTPAENGEIIINDNTSALNGRVSTAEAGVMYISPDGFFQHKGTADTPSNEYPMELVASVAAPIDQGDTLRATHVEINGNYAYVSYNTEGSKYKGAIDVFNINTITAPTLVSSVLFPTIDISAIAYYDNKLYIAGAKDLSNVSGQTNPAIIGYLQLQNGIPTTTFQSAYYTGFAGTSITVSDNKIYLTTGTTGGVYVVNPSNLQSTSNISLTDARCVVANSTYYAVLRGSGGVNIYNKSNNSFVKNISLNTDIAEAKRTMDFNDNYLLIANGLGGIKYYDVVSGTKTGEITLPTSLPGVLNNNDIVTNAVTYNDKLIFSANGAAGAYVCTENTNTHTLNLVGAFGFGIGNSINYVKSKGDYLFVASGRGGLKIIKLTPPNISTSCATLPIYTGSGNLNVNSNQNLQYKGFISLHTVNVNGSLFYCGVMAISNHCNINSNGTLQVQGSFLFGSYNKTLTIGSNATLRVQGNLTIYGNLNLNSGAKLEFVGTNNTVTIYGNVTKGNNVTISGTYTDVNGKL